MLLCKRPIRVKRLNRAVDCGHCRACRLRLRSQWALRMSHEATTYANNCCFVTLTYNRAHLPKNYQLSLYDLQCFFKRLRITLQRRGINTKIKYYACGEYGSKTKRPHYHAIIYGVNTSHAKLIYECWNKSDPHCFKCMSCNSSAAFGYVAGYCTKKLGKGYSSLLKANGLVPEFSTSSQCLGLSEAINNIDMTTGLMRYKGNWRIPPRYYRKKLKLDASLYVDEITDFQSKINNTIRKIFPDGSVLFDYVHLNHLRDQIDLQLMRDFEKWRLKVE